MSKTNLKAAMDALQVNRPLRLGGAPSFAPPIQNLTNPTLVENPTPVEKTTGVQFPTPVTKTTMVDLDTPVGKATPVQKATQVENPTEVQFPTLVQKATLVEKMTPVTKTTEVTLDQTPVVRSAAEQDSSVVLEARAAEGLEKGYTRLPNTILMKMAGGDLTKGEIKILLLIARFTISFQRKLAPLSKTVLERQSGLRGPSVLEALTGLVEKNLIVKVQGDQHRPNMLGLVLPSDWDQLLGRAGTLVKKTTGVQKATPVPEPTPVGKLTPGEVQKTTPAPVRKATYFKVITYPASAQELGGSIE